MKTTINIIKALADKSRLRVVAALIEYEELCACQIVEMLGFSPATVSKHMSLLCNANLIKSRKDGRWVYYSLSGSMPKLLNKWLYDEFSKSNDIKKDKETIKKILAYELSDLCKLQKRY